MYFFSEVLISGGECRVCTADDDEAPETETTEVSLFLFLLFSLFLVLQSLHCHRHCAQKQRSFHWKQMLWRSLSHILLLTQSQCFSFMKALYKFCKMLTRRRSLSSHTCSHPLNVSLSWKLFPALEKQMFRRTLSRVALSHLLHSHIFPSFKTIISPHKT